MIRLSRLTDYAVALLSYMGKEGPTELWAAPDLARRTGIPLPTVSKVLKLLAKNGPLNAERGASGGYRFSRPTTAISVAEIIEAMDGPIAITDCSEGSAHQSCSIVNICPMSDGWNKVNRAVRQALGDMSLAEMGSVLPRHLKKPPLSQIHAAGE